jgi:hypothetical protein
MAARSKVWVCGRSLAGIAASNPARGMDVSRQEESYRVRCAWVRSWSLDNEEALAPYGLLRHEKKYPNTNTKVSRYAVAKSYLVSLNDVTFVFTPFRQHV